MPIVEPAPWRHQYFDHVPCPEDVMIPADDPEAWLWNPKHAWVFDKLQLALSQGLNAAPHGLVPAEFPVFSKPIFNFAGMGASSRVLTDLADYEAHLAPGHMWMQVLDGRHVSTDVAVVNGQAAWVRHATGLPTSQGMFDYWTVHGGALPDLEAKLATWIDRHLSGYTGMLNLETMGGVIIDAHLRFADQWPDLYGEGWVDALVGLYRDRAWHFKDRRREGFSLALFMPNGQRFRHPPPAVVEDVLAMPGISSVQITFYEDKPLSTHSMPPGGFRVALVNAWDIVAGKAARQRLGVWFRTEGMV